MTDGAERWERGQDFSALMSYIRRYSAETCPAERIVQCICSTCGGTTFALQVSDEDGCARRQCLSCSEAAFIADSAEHWEDADIGEAACPCGSEGFEIGVGFSLREDGDVRWITVGGRCRACGVLGVYADWKIDYSPTAHLLSAV